MSLHRNVELVASDDEHDGLMTVFAVIDGVAWPIAAVKAGHEESLSGAPISLALKAAAEAKAEESAQ